MMNYLSHSTQLTTRLISLISSTGLAQQTRNTYVLKRRHPPIVHKIGSAPRKLRVKHKVYDFVEDTDVRKKENLSLVLLDYVEGVGHKGEVVSVKASFGRNNLLLNQLAVYATPENVAKYQHVLEEEDDKLKFWHSSVYSSLTAKFLARAIVPVVMNLDNPWTIEKMHIRASLRENGIVAPDHAISLPDKQISGPNLELQNKLFLVTVTINNYEKAVVRCIIHHHTNEFKRKVQLLPDYWGVPFEPVFPEDHELLNSMPAPPLPKSMRKPT